MKRIIRKLHRLLGLSVGVWAAVTALTGSVLVFSDEIDRWLHPELLQIEGRAAGADVDGAVAAVRQRFPDAGLLSLRLPRADDEPLTVRVDAEEVTNVYVNPYTAEVLGTRAEHGGAMGVLWDLHVHLLSGEAGETVAGVLSLVLIGMLISGVVLWWPGRARLGSGLRVRWNAAALARMFDLHRVCGALAFPLLLVAVVTGAMLVFHSVTTAFLVTTLGGPARSAPPTVRVPPGVSEKPVSQILASADGALPGAKTTSVRFAREPGAPIVVRQRFAANPHPNGRSFVSVDPYTAQVVQVHDWRHAGIGIRASDYKYPLHIGTAVGLPGRILVLVTGLAPVTLLATGAYVWWRRRKLQRTRRSLQGLQRNPRSRGVLP